MNDECRLVEYPDLEVLKRLKEVFSKNDTFGAFFYLPVMNSNWHLSMLSAFEVTSLDPRAKKDLIFAGSKIFYKITKNHKLPDGNKRSAVICTYLFFGLNGKWINLFPSELYELSLLVAQSESRESETVIDLISSIFSQIVENMEDYVKKNKT